MDIANSRIGISNQVSKVLQVEVDNLQQYSRRYTIILDGLAPKANESTESVEEGVKNILATNFKVNPAKLEQEFDKAHGQLTE